MNRKKVLAGILAATMTIGLAVTAHAEEKELSGNLSLLMLNGWVDETGTTGPVLKEKIDAYIEKHPGVTIELKGASSGDIKENFQTAALAGNGADVVMTDNSGRAIDFAAMGLLYPLSELVDPAELEAKYQPGPLQSGLFQGEYYSIPWFMDNCGMYYNIDRLEECGLEVPTTWEELENALGVLKEAGYGGIITFRSAYAFYPFFYQNGCRVIDTSGEIPEVTIDTEEGVGAWEYICKLVQNGYLVESFKEATSWDKVYESFANGEATFLLGGDWCARPVERNNPDLKFGITVMPAGKERATALGGWTLNINAETQNPELAYDFLNYLCSEECDDVLATQRKLSARVGFDFETALEGNEILLPLTEQFPYTYARPAIVNEQAIDEMIYYEGISVATVNVELLSDDEEYFAYQDGAQGIPMPEDRALLYTQKDQHYSRSFFVSSALQNVRLPLCLMSFHLNKRHKNFCVF